VTPELTHAIAIAAGHIWV